MSSVTKRATPFKIEVGDEKISMKTHIRAMNRPNGPNILENPALPVLGPWHGFRCNTNHTHASYNTAYSGAIVKNDSMGGCKQNSH